MAGRAQGRVRKKITVAGKTAAAAVLQGPLFAARFAHRAAANYTSDEPTLLLPAHLAYMRNVTDARKDVAPAWSLAHDLPQVWGQVCLQRTLL